MRSIQQVWRMSAWGISVFGLSILLTSCIQPANPQQKAISNYTRNLALRDWQAHFASWNIWGLPIVSKYKSERVPEIANSLRDLNLDFAVLQEAWMDKDRTKILASSKFLGGQYFDVTRTVGSGLFFMGNTPIESSDFLPFTLLGRLSRIKEGDAWAGKGVSKVTINLKGLPLSIFNTHLIAKYNGNTTRPDHFTPERKMELFEVFELVIEQTDSDAFIIAGDLNSGWGSEEISFWNQLTSLDGTYFERDSGICTVCSDNIYNKEINGQIDYVFVSPRLKLNEAHVEFKRKFQASDGKQINLSDHYGIEALAGISQAAYKVPPSSARASFTSALLSLKYELYDYLTHYNDSDLQARGIEDRLCTHCRIEDSIKKISLYLEAANPTSYSAPEVLMVARRLDSYFSLYQ